MTDQILSENLMRRNIKEVLFTQLFHNPGKSTELGLKFGTLYIYTNNMVVKLLNGNWIWNFKQSHR